MVTFRRLHGKSTSKSDRQLIADARPIGHWAGPFAGDVPVDQEQQLACGLIGWKCTFGLGHLAQLPVVAFDAIGRVDQPPDLGTILKHRRQIFPMRFPRANRHGVGPGRAHLNSGHNAVYPQ